MTDLRAVRLGGILWFLGITIFVVGMVVTQIGYSSYSLTQNLISDLGAVRCGTLSLSLPNGHLYSGYVCSPWHDIFNATIIVEGILLIFGTILIWPSLPSGKIQTAGFGLLLVAGIGSIGVGLFPEDSNFLVHQLSSLLVFVPGNLASIILGASLFRSFRSISFRLYSVLSGVVGLIALLLFLLVIYGPFGAGGIERLIASPLILWVLVAGVALLRFKPLQERQAGQS
jgi:hypothetical membrane protein